MVGAFKEGDQWSDDDENHWVDPEGEERGALKVITEDTVKSFFGWCSWRWRGWRAARAQRAMVREWKRNADHFWNDRKDDSGVQRWAVEGVFREQLQDLLDPLRVTAIDEALLEQVNEFSGIESFEEMARMKLTQCFRLHAFPGGHWAILHEARTGPFNVRVNTSVSQLPGTYLSEEEAKQALEARFSEKDWEQARRSVFIDFRERVAVAAAKGLLAKFVLEIEQAAEPDAEEPNDIVDDDDDSPILESVA